MAYEDTPFQSDNSVSDDAKQVASHAGDRAQDVAGTVKDEAGAVTQTAMSAGGDVVDTVKEQAGTVLDEARLQTRRLMDEGMDQVRTQAEEGQNQLAQVVRSMTGELDSMVDGTNEQGPMVSLVDNARGYGHQIASWLEDNNSDELLTSVRRFAARKPWTFLAAAAGVGFVGARLVRGLAENQADQQERREVQRPAAPRAVDHQPQPENRSLGQAQAPLAAGYPEGYADPASAGAGYSTPGYEIPGHTAPEQAPSYDAPATDHGQHAEGLGVPGAGYVAGQPQTYAAPVYDAPATDYGQHTDYGQQQPQGLDPQGTGYEAGQPYTQDFGQSNYPQGGDYGQPEGPANPEQPWGQR